MTIEHVNPDTLFHLPAFSQIVIEPLWQTETGEGTFGKIVKFQLRDNPLQD